MSELALTIQNETPGDAEAVERLHARAFGPGRFARTAERLREESVKDLKFCFVARVGTLLVGALRLTPILIGGDKALFLGPLTVEQAFMSRGIGRRLMERSLEAAVQHGYDYVLLVGDASYYRRFNFQPVPMGKIVLPGPVDPARLLLWARTSEHLAQASGMVRSSR